MKTFALKVITPKGAVIDKPVSGLYLRGSEGDLAIFAGHVPFVTAVREGKCTIVYDDSSMIRKRRSEPACLTLQMIR